MKLFNLFTRRTPKTTKKSNRTVLSLNSLEARDVPAASVLDLSAPGSHDKINGAIFSQYNDHSKANANDGAITPFLRIDDNGKEQGYNTNARPLQFDESRNATKALMVSDIPSVVKGGVEYKELVLDVNEPWWSPKVSLDEMRIYVSDNPNLKNYKNGKDTLGGLSPVWDMDAKKDWSVRIDASNNHKVGTGDMTFLIRADLLTGGTYLSLFTRFGERNAAGGTYEQWGTRSEVVDQPPVTIASSISGHVWLSRGSGNETPNFGYDVTVSINGALPTPLAINADGSYTLTENLESGTSVSLKFVGNTATGEYGFVAIPVTTLAAGDDLSLDFIIEPIG